MNAMNLAGTLVEKGNHLVLEAVSGLGGLRSEAA